jgi:DNA-binding response OmpR family regulator
MKHIDDLEPLCIALDLNGDAVNGCKMITKIRDISDSFLITMAYPSDETLIIKALDIGK